MGVTIWSSVRITDTFNKPVDMCGQAAFLFHRSHRLCRFIQAFSQANIMSKLACEKGSSWMIVQDVIKLPGLCRDKFDRATQFNDLEKLGLIERQHTAGHPGLWGYQNLKVTSLGLEMSTVLREPANVGVIVVYEGPYERCLPFLFPQGWI